MKRFPVAFRHAEDFRAWLEKSGEATGELFVRCYKASASGRGMTYMQALGEALCFGWIDGVRHAVDAVSFSVRFTPRSKSSIWSAVNIRRIRQLEKEGRLRPSGRAAFDARQAKNTGRYSFEANPVELAPEYAKKLGANRRASQFFQAQPPWYRRTSSFWVMSAKQEETRLRRLGILIASSEKGEPIPPLDRRR